VIINSLNGTSPVPADYPLPRDTDRYPTLDSKRQYLRDFYFNKEIVTESRLHRTLEMSTTNFEFAKARRAVLGQTPAEWNRNLL